VRVSALIDGTIDLDAITVTGTKAEFNTAAQCDSFAFFTDKLCVFAATSSAELITIISDESGSGLLVFNCSPSLVTPALGTPSALVLTSATALPVAGLADGTDGELITWDCAGVATTVPVGTINHVPTSGGTGAEPTFQVIPTQTESFMLAASDETTALTTGLKITFHMPYAFTLTDIKGSLTTASCCGGVVVDVHEGACTIMACCKLDFDVNETSTECATCAPVISDTALADNAVMTIIVDTAGMCATGLKVTLIGTQT